MTCGTQRTAPPPIRVPRGTTWTLLFTVRDAKGSVDLTGALVWFTVKNRLEDVSAAIAKRNAAAGGVDNQALVSLPQSGLAKGQFRVFGDPADTAPLDPAAHYLCDAFVQFAGGPPLKRYQVIENTQFIVDSTVTTEF